MALQPPHLLVLVLIPALAPPNAETFVVAK